jgi:hypothetical protein
VVQIADRRGEELQKTHPGAFAGGTHQYGHAKAFGAGSAVAYGPVQPLHGAS